MRKVLCVYESQQATDYNDYTDILFVGFTVSEELMEQLYMAGKKQILCIDFDKPNHPLQKLAVKKNKATLLDYAGKWAILVKDENELNTVLEGLKVNET